MKKIKIVMIMIILFMLVSFVQAGLLDSVVSKGNEFKSASTSTSLGNAISGYLKTELLPIIQKVGYLIIAIVTVILGTKYIWSSSEGRAAVKNTLPTFVIGIIFFYLGEKIVTLIQTDFSTSVTSYDSFASRLVGIINSIIQIAAFAGIIYTGIKYMFSSSSGKADIKESTIPLIMGIILVFCASNFVSFAINSANQILE